MKYDIYIPQTNSVFDESELESGIWLSNCGDDLELTVRSLVRARTLYLKSGEPVDLVIRAFPECDE